jgi:hypothetical protein
VLQKKKVSIDGLNWKKICCSACNSALASAIGRGIVCCKGK